MDEPLANRVRSGRKQPQRAMARVAVPASHPHHPHADNLSCFEKALLSVCGVKGFFCGFNVSKAAIPPPTPRIPKPARPLLLSCKRRRSVGRLWRAAQFFTAQSASRLAQLPHLSASICRQSGFEDSHSRRSHFVPVILAQAWRCSWYHSDIAAPGGRRATFGSKNDRQPVSSRSHSAEKWPKSVRSAESLWVRSQQSGLPDVCTPRRFHDFDRSVRDCHKLSGAALDARPDDQFRRLDLGRHMQLRLRPALPHQSVRRR